MTETYNSSNIFRKLLYNLNSFLILSIEYITLLRSEAALTLCKLEAMLDPIESDGFRRRPLVECVLRAIPALTPLSADRRRFSGTLKQIKIQKFNKKSL